MSIPQNPAAHAVAPIPAILDAGGAATPEVEVVGPEPMWRALTRGKGLVGAILVGLVILAGLLAPLIAPFSPTEQIPGAQLFPPGGAHLLGTDDVSRDLFSRVLYGIRVDLIVVFLAVPIGAAIGSAMGLAAAFWNWADILLQRTLDLLLAFPTIVLAIALSMLVGPGMWTVVVVVAIVEIPSFGRLVRTSVLTVRELPYVEAAKVSGASNWWLLRKHVLPNSLEPLTVQLTLGMSVAVFVEGAMSFLGLGVAAPTPSLGSLIKEGTRVMYHSPTAVIGPLVVVVVLVLGLLLVSEALGAHSRKK